jgi:hypothetical protein
MKCLQCGRENRADAAFCDECGTGLEASCPGCREPNRLGAKFCRKCGQSLGSAHHPTPIGPVAILRTAETYTPKHLAEKILSSKNALTATAMYREMDMRFWLDQAEAELRHHV